ncbi:MAG: Rrf2 family transcriptional regulator [Planctomycetota bacterium]
MLRISKKGDYAVFIMGYLATHGAAPGGGVVSAQEITDRSGLSKAVVANLLKDLAKGGLLESTRGLHGGYRLARPATDISLGRILEIVEGPFVLVDCAQDHNPAESDPAACSLVSFCPSKRPMRVLHQRIASILDELRLPELVEAPAVFDAPSHANDLNAPSTSATTR